MDNDGRKHLVIIGAGFAGLKLARKLNNHPDFQITLIDKNNYHQFQPLLYQVASANLDASNVSFPLRNIFKRSKNVSIRIGEVFGINQETNKLETSFGRLGYDYLIIATGAITNFFGNSQIESRTFPMKSTLEALQIRNTMIQHFEDALSSKLADIETSLSIVVVGGGPTGVEMSGALAELKRDTLPLEYPELDFTKMQVILLEGGPKLLGTMSKVSSQKSESYLKDMGVTVMTNSLVKEYDGHTIILQNGTSIESSLVIWAAGVKGTYPAGIPTNTVTANQQLKTEQNNLLIGSKNIFVLGDVAMMESEEFPKGYPQLASVAIGQAENLANNFIRMAKGQAILPYKFVDKGSMATVGRNKAVVDMAWPKWSFQGFFAWLVWMGLHLFLLIGFKNKIVVFINWVYKYFTFRQSLSLLFKPLARK